MMTDTIPEILLYSGNYFNFLQPECHNYLIRDIAHSLSLTNRYSGHTKYAYNVAQHSVLCSYLVPDDYALEKLMHDASEAYLGDIASPLKQLLTEYKIIEAKVESAIAKQFGLCYPFPSCVKEADMRMLRTEFEDVVSSRFIPDCCAKFHRASFEITQWTAEYSEEMFLNRYYKLTKEE